MVLTGPAAAYLSRTTVRMPLRASLMRSQGQSRLALRLPDRSWSGMSGHSDLGRRTARFDPSRSLSFALGTALPAAYLPFAAAPIGPSPVGYRCIRCGRKNRTFSSFREYEPLCSIEDSMFEIRSRPIGNGCSRQTSKSRYVTPGPAATRRFPIVAHWIHAIIAPSITSVARRCERVVVRHLHQLVQLPSPNAHVPAIEQR